MAAAHAWSAMLDGVDGVLVEAEATVDLGRPGTDPLDRPASTETRDRVRSAVLNSELTWPSGRITLRVAPPASAASAAADLAVACAVLAADGQVPAGRLDDMVLLGELALDGRVLPVRGVLPALLAAQRAGLRRAVVPAGLLREAVLVSGIQVLGARRLSDVVGWLRGADEQLAVPGPPISAPASEGADLADVVGQPEAVAALEVAAAGGHHLLLIGASGSGTSMLAHRLPSLLPPLSGAQALAVTAIHSLAGTLSPQHPLITQAPFQAPHHSVSIPALLGGGAQVVRPGAISLAHHGVLFLDQVGEFGPHRLESLRTALDSGEIRLTRRDRVTRYPTRVLLVAATAPCPCAIVPPRVCACSPQATRRYLARISGVLLDRIDLRVRLRPTPAGIAAQSSAVVRERVLQARRRAADRWAAHGIATNAEVPATVLRDRAFRLPHSVTGQLDRALEMGAVTGRGADRALRVAWTLSDIAGLDRPGTDQIREALQLRDRRPS